MAGFGLSDADIYHTQNHTRTHGCILTILVPLFGPVRTRSPTPRAGVCYIAGLECLIAGLGGYASRQDWAHGFP